MELYYAPPASVAGDSLVIEGEEAAHMAAVMRHRPGDAILVTDGAGTLFDAVIEAVEKRSVSCSVRGRRPGGGEPRRRVVLAAALLRNPSRFDTLVEKVFTGEEVKVLETLKGRKLKAVKYHPLFTFMPPDRPAHYIVLGDFVRNDR